MTNDSSEGDGRLAMTDWFDLDPEAPLPSDAIEYRPWGHSHGLLPDWYMPAPAGAVLPRGWRRRIAITVIAAILAINALGLCVTYGQVTFG